MAVREIVKQLAGAEDLLLGEGTVNQERFSGTRAMTKVGAASLPYDDRLPSDKSIKDMLELATATTAQLEDLAASINTTDKSVARLVLNSTTEKVLRAKLATAAGVWVDLVGATVHTPV